MIEYITCAVVLLCFIVFLHLLGMAFVKDEEKSTAYKFMIGYIVYSFFVAIGGIIIQFINLPWKVFEIYMIALFVFFIGFIIFKKVKGKKLMHTTILEYIKNYWFLYLIVIALGVMLLFYYRGFWLGNHQDDGYYIMKAATVPYDSNGFRSNFAVGISNNDIFDSRILNTWEIEAAFFIKMFDMSPTLWLRFFQSIFNYFLWVNCVYAFISNFVPMIKVNIKKHAYQYFCVIILLFGIFDRFLSDNGILYIVDAWQVQTAMFYGSSIIRCFGIFFIIFPFMNTKKIDIKTILSVIAISIVLVSKSGIVLPMIFAVSIAFLLTWLLFDKEVKKIIPILIFAVISIISIILGDDGSVSSHFYRILGNVISHWVPIVALVILVVCTLVLKEEWIYRMNIFLLIIAIFLLVPGLNNIVEKLSMYGFVMNRLLSCYLYTMIITAFIYLMLVLYKISAGGFVPILNIFLYGGLSSLLVIGFMNNGGLILDTYTSENRPKPDLIESFKIIYNNSFFAPESTIELGEVLESLNESYDTQVIAVMPSVISVDDTLHPLSTSIRVYAPNIVVASALERYPEDTSNVLNGFDQTVVNGFIDNPNAETAYSFGIMIQEYDVNCIVTTNSECQAWLEEMGYYLWTTVDENRYQVYIPVDY